LFPDEQSAFDFIDQERWLEGIVCPHCESERFGKPSSSSRYQCNGCRLEHGVRIGTIF